MVEPNDAAYRRAGGIAGMVPGTVWRLGICYGGESSARSLYQISHYPTNLFCIMLLSFPIKDSVLVSNMRVHYSHIEVSSFAPNMETDWIQMFVFGSITKYLDLCLLNLQCSFINPLTEVQKEEAGMFSDLCLTIYNTFPDYIDIYVFKVRDVCSLTWSIIVSSTWICLGCMWDSKKGEPYPELTLYKTNNSAVDFLSNRTTKNYGLKHEKVHILIQEDNRDTAYFNIWGQRS